MCFIRIFLKIAWCIKLLEDDFYSQDEYVQTKKEA